MITLSNDLNVQAPNPQSSADQLFDAVVAGMMKQ